MGTLPISISLGVGAIGVFGFVAALVANRGIEDERDAVRRGRNALGDLPVDGTPSSEYRQWLKEQRLDDFHFGDHLRAAVDSRSSGRAITLNEFHQISARREARRRSAILSGGITGLLLVCGIAGTLWCIKPVLSEFNVSASPDASVSGPDNRRRADNLIHGLSHAFWPSLVALILTVVVAFARGFYTHNKGMLAGELDQLDMEDLFRRFPPPSLARELNGIRSQLAELSAQMLASQSNFDRFVQKLSDAAAGFKTDAPLLQGASADFVKSVDQLNPKLDVLGTTIADHLGAASPIVARFDGLQAVASEVSKTSGQMKVIGTVLSKHVAESHQLLKTTVDTLPTQLAAACESASTIIAEAASQALAAACADAVARLDSAAEPLRQAAHSIAEENRALKADTNNAIIQLTQSVQDLCDATAAAVTKDVSAGVVSVTNQVESLLRHAYMEFSRAIDTAVASITPIHTGFNQILSNITALVDELKQVETWVEIAVRDSGETRDIIDNARRAIVAAADQVNGIQALVDNTRQMLTGMRGTCADTTKRLDELASSLGILHPALDKLVSDQRDTGVRIESLIQRAEAVGAQWTLWLPEASQLHVTGTSLHRDLDQLLEQGRTVAEALAATTAAAGAEQQRLADELALLVPALNKVSELHQSNAFKRFFGSKS
ncbi:MULTISPECIES: hypothetical protein [unclassified Thiocapsa]|uniref:hypothetical protein n=1 Tax=unclassified Thiocapsa TaxID=2641286 RepID=UPI0035B240C1